MLYIYILFVYIIYFILFIFYLNCIRIPRIFYKNIVEKCN